MRLLREKDPELRAVLMTGMVVDDLRPELDALGNVDVVSKPFDYRKIVERLDLGAAH